MKQVFTVLAEQLYLQSLLIVSLQERVEALEKTHPDIEGREAYLRDAKRDYEPQREAVRNNYASVKQMLASIQD